MSKETIYNRLMSAIGNPYGVCGIMGNLRAESALKSTNLQDSGNRRLGITDEQYVAEVDSGKRNFVDNRGFGLAQWTSGGRKAALLAFAKERGKSIGDEDMQVDFLIHELNTSYKNVMKVLKSATSVRQASDVVVKKYERPANQSESILKKRASYGEEFYEQFASVDVTPKDEGKEEEMNITQEVRAYSKAKDGTKKLSTNFKVKEFACKDGSDPIFIAPSLVEILQKIRSHFGKAVNINSAYRTPTYNKKVGGATYSQHLYGKAADIRVTGVKPKDVAAYVETLMPNSGGIGIYPNFTHVDIRETKSRWNG